MNRRACPDCGAAVDTDEQFCGSCGCYLDWTDVQEPEPAAAGPAGTAPPPPVQRRGARPVPATPPEVPRPGTAERPPPQQPAAQQPRAQQPGRPAPGPRRPVGSGPPEPLDPGDLVCGACGTGNKPTRRFCRRCGHDLSEAEAAKVPWWRRLLRRRTKVREAGSRPRAPRGDRRLPVRLLVVLGLVAALGVGGYAARGYVVDGVELVRDRVSGAQAVKAGETEIRTSSSHRGHGAGELRDGDPREYWAPRRPGKGVGEWVEIRFEQPVRLVQLTIIPGVTDEDEETFLQQGRPADLRMVIDREGAATEVEDVHLPDERGPIDVGVAESDVTRVRLEIEDAYEGTAPGARTAIAEIEVFVRE